MPTRRPSIVVIAHNIRSTHNVGAIFRTAEGLGVERIICSGYTPYPALPANDPRLPHLAEKLTRQIHKTALGAEELMPFTTSTEPPLAALRRAGYIIAGLEQNPHAVLLPHYQAPAKLALLLGEEVAGIAPELQAACDVLLEIPMVGHKESFNVSVAAGMALYQLLCHN